MQRLLSLIITAFCLLFILGCDDTDNGVSQEFRGNPIEGERTGVLSLENSPYLVTDTLIVPDGQVLRIDPGVELRFDVIVEEGIEKSIPFLVYGSLVAKGSPEAPIKFTSGKQYPTRGDWDGVWMIESDQGSEFEYCEFNFGAKYGGHYLYNPNLYEGYPDSVAWEYGVVDSVLWDYGSITLHKSSPSIKRCWFVSGGFHGISCGTEAYPVIENCVFYDNAGHGVFIHNDANPEIRYNILSENDDYGVYFRQPPGIVDERDDNLTLEYNIVWSNFSGEFNALAPLGYGRVSTVNANLDSCDLHYNLRQDPSFKVEEEIKDTPTEWEFRLNPCSAAIDAGPPIEGDDDKTRRIELGIWPYQYRPGEIRRLITIPTLERANSPYFMSCGTRLPHGETLTIEAGVEIVVEGRFEMRVQGKLLSMGTAANPVIIRPETEEPGSWIGIRLEAGGGNDSELHYTHVLYALTGITFKERDGVLDHCTIAGSEQVGIHCENFASPTINFCRLEANSLSAIRCESNSSPDIMNCRIVGGAGYGLFALESSKPLVQNNLFYNIGVDGIRLENLSSARIVNNTFALNNYFGLNCVTNSSPLIQNNIFYANGNSLNGGNGIIASRSSRPEIIYNCFFGHMGEDVLISGHSELDTNVNLQADPSFVDAGNGNFQLTGNSPCRGYGRNPDDPNDDTPFDIGASGEHVRQ